MVVSGKEDKLTVVLKLPDMSEILRMRRSSLGFTERSKVPFLLEMLISIESLEYYMFNFKLKIITFLLIGLFSSTTE